MIRFAVIAALFLSAATSVRAGDIYGALFFDPDSAAWGASSSQSDPTLAEVVALANCEANNPSSTSCELIFSLEGDCGVIAVGDDGAWGSGRDVEDWRAEEIAVAVCEDHGGYNCTPELRVCGDE